MKELYDEFLIKNKAIVIEPLLKTIRIRDFIQDTALALLKAHEYKLESITTMDYFIIVRLQDNSRAVDAINILKHISGISFIFIGIPVQLNYDTIVDTVSTIQSNIMLEGERYYLLVKSIDNTNLNTNEDQLKKFDMEFSIQSELSSTSKKLIRVENYCDADRIIYVLLTPSIGYVSMLAYRGQDNIPVNYLQDTILCPIFDNISLISFISVLKAGYSAVPFFFYLHKQHLQKLLTTFEKLIIKSSLIHIKIYIFSMQEHVTDKVQQILVTENNKTTIDKGARAFHWLNFQFTILRFLEKSNLDIKMIGLPITPFAHPAWFIQEMINLFKESDKIGMTPLLFNYPNQQLNDDVLELSKLGLNFDCNPDKLQQLLDTDEGKLKEITRACSSELDNFSLKFTNFTLRIGKDDILDIFNTV